ncbi:MAG: IBR domain-containing protein [Thermoleophilia bacterium]|nr:IBR domain-containing protein [Thermoleophilia bacterium]
MPSVRCPSCDTAQHVEAGSRGYSCSSCGKEWAFAVCRSCGSRFHAKPGATSWTCPRCGLLQDASAEPAPAPVAKARTVAPTPMTITDAELDRPQEPPVSAFPAGLGLGDDGEGPEDAFAMPVRESSGRPVWIYVVAAVLVVVVALVSFNLISGGDDGEAPAGGTGEQVSGEAATATMCGHVQQVQVFRDDALGAAAEQLKEDIAALKQAGERRTAKQVRAVVGSIGEARTALATQEDTSDAFAALQTAMAGLPC